MGMRPIDKLTAITAILGMGISLPQSRSGSAVVHRELPPGEATEDQKRIRGPKVGKRTKRWRRKQNNV